MGIRDWFGGKRKTTDEVDVKVNWVAISGPPELQHLFIDIPVTDLLRALEGWKWLQVDGLTAIAISAFGEVFFQNDSGLILQIDTIEGKLLEVASSLSDFIAQLQEIDCREKHLFGGFVIAARDRGLILKQGECYDFRVAPILGGEMAADQIDMLSFVVKLHIAGQLHEQVKDLPPGTPINNITISD